MERHRLDGLSVKMICQDCKYRWRQGSIQQDANGCRVECPTQSAAPINAACPINSRQSADNPHHRDGPALRDFSNRWWSKMGAILSLSNSTFQNVNIWNAWSFMNWRSIGEEEACGCHEWPHHLYSLHHTAAYVSCTTLFASKIFTYAVARPQRPVRLCM